MNLIFKLYTMMQARTGAAKLEYALLVALISIAAITALGTLGTNISDKFNEVNTAIAP